MNRRELFFVAAMFAAAGSAVAQGTSQETHHRTMIMTHEASGMSGSHAISALGPGSFGFIAAGGADMAKTIANAPYSAEAATEMTRILGDGTRIVTKHTAVMARDKEGRTRREMSLGNIGPWTSSNVKIPRIVTITDPVAKEMVILNADEKTATKSKLNGPTVFRTEKNDGNKREVFESRIEVRSKMATSGGHDVVSALPVLPGQQFTYQRVGPKGGVKENLGKQNMEGVMVEGTRTTHTIAAGEIGNDRPIVSVEESWYSPELQMVIYSKTTDPQFGETVYRVNGLRRTDPDAGMFKVPADYKVNEKSMTAPMIIRKKLAPGSEEI